MISIPLYIFYCNFPTLVVLFLLFNFTMADKTFPKKTVLNFIHVCFSIGLLILCDSLSFYFEKQKEPCFMQTVSNTIAYIARLLMLYFALQISTRENQSRSIFNFLLICISSLIIILNIKFNYIFEYDETNISHHNKLGFIPYLGCGIFLIEMIITAIKNLYKNKMESFFIFAISVVAIFSTFIESIEIAHFIVPGAGAVSILFYYLILNVDIYKRDPLTKLLNRRNFEIDCAKYTKNNFIIVSMDLNDLKLFNDTHGHDAGDKALLTSVYYMKKHLEKFGLLYRTGGDEFMAIFPKKNLELIEKSLSEMQEDMKKTPYKVACGAAEFKKGDNLQQKIAFSDNLMYQNKKLLKLNTTQ